MEGDRITNGTWNYILRLWPCCDCDISFSKWMLYCMSVFRRQNRIHPDLGPVFSIFSAFPPPPQYYLWCSRSVVVCIGQCLPTVGIPGPSSWHIAPCRWILCGWVRTYVCVCVIREGAFLTKWLQASPQQATKEAAARSWNKVLITIASFTGFSRMRTWVAERTWYLFSRDHRNQNRTSF